MYVASNDDFAVNLAECKERNSNFTQSECQGRENIFFFLIPGCNTKLLQNDLPNQCDTCIDRCCCVDLKTN